MPHATPLRETFAHTKAGHCGSGSLRDLLAFHGLDYGAGPLSEGAAFGLGGGLGFLYLDVPQLRPPVYLVGRTASLEEDIARHLGLGLAIRETDDPAEGWAWVREAIDDGQPPLILADIQELEYLRVRMHNTRHSIVVVDYDQDAGLVWIADNDREELQACSMASLAAARASTGFPGPNHHRVYGYDGPAALRDPRAATRSAVAGAIANMRGGGDALAGLPGATGLAGVDAFAAAYEGWPDTFGEDLEAALKGLWVFIVKAGTGGAMFRSLHAEFLRDLGSVLGDAGLAEAAREYDALAEAWVALAATAGDGDHARGLGHVAEIARREHEGVAAMERWLAG
jgi:hypothetical protein